MRKFFSTSKSSFPKLGFLVIGTQKAGTTALDHYCRSHPQIGLADRKELHFFDDETIFDNNHTANYRLLHTQYTTSIQHSIYGEMTPIYLYWKNALRRIYQYNPQIKIIVILRNPMERAFSHWTMEHNRGNESLPFSEAIRQEKQRLSIEPNQQHRVYSYIDRGRYAQQIKLLYSLFPKEQSLIIDYEKLHVLHENMLSKIYQFLQVDDISSSQEFRTIFSNDYKELLRDSDSHFIYDQLKEDIEELEIMMNWDLSAWKK